MLSSIYHLYKYKSDENYRKYCYSLWNIKYLFEQKFYRDYRLSHLINFELLKITTYPFLGAGLKESLSLAFKRYEMRLSESIIGKDITPNRILKDSRSELKRPYSLNMDEEKKKLIVRSVVGLATRFYEKNDSKIFQTGSMLGELWFMHYSMYLKEHINNEWLNKTSLYGLVSNRFLKSDAENLLVLGSIMAVSGTFKYLTKEFDIGPISFLKKSKFWNRRYQLTKTKKLPKNMWLGAISLFVIEEMYWLKRRWD
eukprot:TRINITY_DN12501_c0_g1_i1.p1 TRINITY_DN12501_c0_g1~~TRINITY_DN12501_c0_g1_i1.p1  ORF type:complete len:255 (-),score=17.11 TRINITY_DN12501_c0_g1_i1:34-798(-)